jgi:hypothetical protein
MFPPVEHFTYTQKLGLKLIDIENEGFHLYYDEKTREWEMMSEHSELSITGTNKEQVINDGWRQLMLG